MPARLRIPIGFLFASLAAWPAWATPAVVERLRAFESVKGALEQEARTYTRIKTATVPVDRRTVAADILGFMPAKNPDPHSTRGQTPASLQGVYWMRGNPLSDYLLSFANFHWTSVDGTPYGFYATFAPGSFAWKERTVAQGAPRGDYGYVPKICRVPKEDRVLDQIAHLNASHDARTYTRGVALDLAEIGQPGSDDEVSEEAAERFVDGVWKSGQQPDLDGAKLVEFLAKEHFFYEAKFNRAYTESTVTIFKLFSWPVSAALEVPEAFASFSLAPHPEDPNVFVRKSFIKGLSAPNYYWLTRIIDGNGDTTRHFDDFIQCVQERSHGRIVKVQAR